jgi:hypothetical protein
VLLNCFQTASTKRAQKVGHCEIRPHKLTLDLRVISIGRHQELDGLGAQFVREFFLAEGKPILFIELRLGDNY